MGALTFIHNIRINSITYGGRGGIRTHGGREPTAVFKTAALNHSATRPGLVVSDAMGRGAGQGRGTGAARRRWTEDDADRGPFVDGRILDLSRAAAVELGFEREGVARVRVRYVGPAPSLASGVRVAGESAPEAAAPNAALSAAPAPIDTAYAEPIPYPRDPHAAPESLPASEPAAVPVAAPAGYAIQAAAFRSRDNAERAAALLGDAGRTSVQAVGSAGGTLYRVMVTGFPDEDSAAEAWVRVRDAGFPGARVVGPG